MHEAQLEISNHLNKNPNDPMIDVQRNHCCVKQSLKVINYNKDQQAPSNNSGKNQVQKYMISEKIS